MSLSVINRSVNIFFSLSDTAAFEAKFNSFKLLVERLLEWFETAKGPTAMKIMDGMEFKASGRKYALKEPYDLLSRNLSPSEPGTQQTREGLGAFLAV